MNPLSSYISNMHCRVCRSLFAIVIMVGGEVVALACSNLAAQEWFIREWRHSAMIAPDFAILLTIPLLP